MKETEIIEFKIRGTEMKKKKVGRAGTTGIVYLPKDWIGEGVTVIRH